MAGFRSVKQYAEAWDAGRSFTSHFRKFSTIAPSNVMFIDLSTIGGGPPANYYASAPLVAATLDGTSGIYHGDDKAPSAKYLTSLMMCNTSNSTVGTFFLLDYLLYYPFVDCDDTTAQTMTNTTTLPRYTDGEGVMVMAVCVSAGSGNGAFSFEYVNQDGVTKTSPTNNCVFNGGSSAPAPGNCLATTAGATTPTDGVVFCALAAGDRGVRQINSVTFSIANGGLACFVLVKPLAQTVIRELTAPSEIEFITQTTAPPRIYDGAYLNIVGKCPFGIQSLPIVGRVSTIWDEGT